MIKRKYISKKIIIIFIICIFSISIIFSGSLTQKEFDPYNRIIKSESTTYTSGVTSVPGDDAGPIITLYKEFINNYNVEESDLSPEPFCRYGGQYKYNLFNDPSPRASTYNKTFNLYYCRTTLDLINEIKIPQSWLNSNLILYCNDGGNINFKNQNLDFLISKVSSIYKGCIIKNLDIDNLNNTIFYGLLSGNNIVDNYNYLSTDLSNTFQLNSNYSLTIENYASRNLNLDSIISSANANSDITTATNNIMNEISKHYKLSSGSKSRIIDIITKRFQEINKKNTITNINYSYNQLTSGDKNEIADIIINDKTNKFYIKSKDLNLDTPITNIFNSIPSNFGISRVALFRTYKSTTENHRQIYGFETAAKFKEQGQTNENKIIKPIYSIKFDNFFGIENLCMRSLGYYSPVKSFNDPVTSQKVICGNNNIILNTNAIDPSLSSYGGKSFTLFKNIILNMN